MTPISSARQLAHDLIASWSQIPCLLWLPQDVNEGPPCYVIGRPQLIEGNQRSLMTIEIPVYAIGRTSTAGDDGAQAELDAAADALADQLWKPPQSPDMAIRLARIQPTVTPIGPTDYPTYTATLLASTAPC